MKIPKSVRIRGIDWAINIKNKCGEGMYDFKKLEITIRKNTQARMMQVLWHEVREIIQDCFRTKWQHCDTNGGLSCIFIANHQEFENMVEEEYNVLRNLFGKDAAWEK